MAAGDTDMTFISAAVIYKLLKQFYYDAGCFPNNLTQSVYESVFQSVPRFSHVRYLSQPRSCFSRSPHFIARFS